MRFFPALAVALLPFVAAAQTDEWVRDDMTDESLWLVRTGNLSRETSTAGIFPGAPERGSQWVVSKGDGPAYVVYFLPGAIHEVEIDTHRLAGAAGDFTLAVSTDGKLYQPINAGSVLLDSSFGWDYRLMASDQIPENATHLLVQFPNGSTAHRLSEVWIRYTWDDARVNQFLPAPAVTPPAQSEFSLQSDADLQLLLDQLMAQPRKDPTPSVERLDTFTPAQLPSAPEPQASFVVAPPFEYAPAIAQPEAMPAVEEEEDEEVVETTEPAVVVGETTQPENGETKEPGDEDIAPDAPTVAEESTPAIVADVPDAGNEASELPTDSPVVAENADAPEQPIEPTAGLLDASVAEATSSASGVTEIDVSKFSSSAESDARVLTVESTIGAEEANEIPINLLESAASEAAPSPSGESEIDVAEFSPDVGAIPALESVAATNAASESIEVEPLAITAAEPETAAIPKPVPVPSSATALQEIPPVATEVAEIGVAEFSSDVDTAPALEPVAATIETSESFETEPLAIAAAEPQSPVTNEMQPSTEAAPVVEELEPVATELVATPEPAPSSESVSEKTTPAVTEVTEIAVAEFKIPAAAASELIAPAVAPPAEESTPTFDLSRLAFAEANGPTVPDVEVANRGPIPPELAPAPAALAGTEPIVVADAPVGAPSEEPPPITASQPDLAIVELPAETPEQVDVIDPSAFADPEVEVAIAAITPEIIADPPTPAPAVEEPEQVWRLPPFDLPIMSASQARESAASNEESVPPQSEAQTVAQDPPQFAAIQSSTEEIAAASTAVDPPGTQQTEVAATRPEVAAPVTSPAAPSDSGPMLIAAAQEPAVDAPESKISDAAEPHRKPTMKVRRIGPRSKSRDSYSARG